MSPFDRRIVFHFNWSLMGLTVLLFTVGVLNLYSASAFRLEEGITLQTFYQKQLIWGAVGLGGMAVFVFFDYRHLQIVAWPLFVLALALLASTLLFGKVIYGARRWLDLGVMSFQASEMAKIAILVLGAKILARGQSSLGWLPLLYAVGLGLLPAAFIVLQPDLGSALNLLLILGGIILYRGVRWKVLRFLLILGPALLPLGWFFLHDYQKHRILTFLDPSVDPRGKGYHIIQSQIAMGSGQFWGKGFLGGTQSQLRFLPEKHTDFAVAVFGEEWGFVGCIILLSIFCLFLYHIFLAAQDAKDRFGSFLAAGVFFYFFWQILINMGMVLGLMPVVGIPLPFISYGGSATLVNFCLIGLVMNVSMRRFLFKQG